MKNEKLYITYVGDGNSEGEISGADYEKLSNNNDPRVYNLDNTWFIVKPEHLKDVESEYDCLTFIPFSEDFVNSSIAYDIVGEVVTILSRENDLLSFWREHSFSKEYCIEVYKEVLKELYSMPVDDLLAEITKGNYYTERVKQRVEKKMYTTLINELKDELAEKYSK